MEDPESMSCVDRIGTYAVTGAAIGTVVGGAREALKAGKAIKNTPPVAYWAEAAGRLARGTGRTVVGLALFSSAECAMATIRNKEDVWNIAFGGGVMGAYSGLKLNSVHGAVMRSFKYSAGLSLAWMCFQHIQGEGGAWRDPAEEMKKRFAYVK